MLKKHKHDAKHLLFTPKFVAERAIHAASMRESYVTRDHQFFPGHSVPSVYTHLSDLERSEAIQTSANADSTLVFYGTKHIRTAWTRFHSNPIKPPIR
jgi:hypothetical protein